MEQLIKNNQVVRNAQDEWTHMMDYQRMMISSVFKKLKLTLSRGQLETLRGLLQIYLTTGEMNSIWQKASQMMAFVMYERINKLYLKSIANSYKLKLDISEAAFIFDVIEELSCSGLGDYEENVMLYIVGEINRQTV